jgi:hypothetical protein
MYQPAAEAFEIDRNGYEQYPRTIYKRRNRVGSRYTPLCIPEVLPSDLRQDTDYLDWGFRGFPQPIQANAGAIQITVASFPAFAVHYPACGNLPHFFCESPFICKLYKYIQQMV